jgi:hypothetical protein
VQAGESRLTLKTCSSEKALLSARFILVSCLAYFSILKTETIYFSKKYVKIDRTIWGFIWEETHLQSPLWQTKAQHRENSMRLFDNSDQLLLPIPQKTLPFISYYAVRDLINALPGNSSVNTAQHATIADAVLSASAVTSRSVGWWSRNMFPVMRVRSSAT